MKDDVARLFAAGARPVQLAVTADTDNTGQTAHAGFADAHFVAADQGQDVPSGLDGVARVGLDDGQHIFIERSGPYQFEVGNAGALFKHRAGVGRETQAAHVNGVAG